MTNQPKHTPGPWTVSQMFNVTTSEKAPSVAPSVWLDRLADGGTGLELGFTSCVPRERIVADANLIASAPQLLEALRNLDDFVRLAVDEGLLNAEEAEWRLIESREALAAAGVEVKP